MAIGDSSPIAKLAVHLGLETARFEKGVGKAKKEVTGLERHVSKAGAAIKTAFVGMFGALAVGQLASMAKESLDFAGSLGEVAKQLGVSTDALQSFRYVATQVGVEQDEMDKGLAKLTRTIGEAVQGSKSAVSLFDRLGISVRDSSGQVKAAEDVLLEVSDAYVKLGSEAERSALAADVFGAKLGQKLNPALELGAAGLNKTMREAKELGLVLSADVIQNADDASDNITKLSNVLSLQFTSAVSKNAKEIAYLVQQLIELINKAGLAIKTLQGFRNLRETEGIWTALNTPFSEMANYAERESYVTSYYGRKPLKFVPDTTMPSKGLSGARLPARAPFQLAPIVGWPQRRAAGSSSFGGMDWSRFAPGQGSGFIRMSEAANDLVKPVERVDAFISRIALQTGVRMVANFRDAAIEGDRIASAAQNIVDRLFPQEARARQYADELALLKLQYGAAAENAALLAEAEKRLRAEWIQSLPAVEAIGRGLRKYQAASEDAASQSEVNTVRIAQSYADMADSISSSLGNLIGGKTGNMLSSLVSLGLTLGKAGAFGGDFASSLNNIPGRATGGPISAGRPYLVGERGPELVVPRHSAQVIPNHQLGGRQVVEIVDTTGLFKFRVAGQIREAAPAIVAGGAAGAVGQIRRSASRRYA